VPASCRTEEGIQLTKISILTISYNQDKYLRECLDSVLRQDYDDWELFVIDPGSTDLSRMIALEYSELDSRVRCIFEEDLGPADGLNKGLRAAQGEIVGCLNSDDLYRDSTFSEVLEFFQKESDADCIYSHGLILESGRFRFQSSDNFSAARYFTKRGLVMQQSTFFRRSSLARLDVWFNAENKSSWDGELLLDLYSRGGKFKKVLGCWGVFRIYPQSITGSKRLQELTRGEHSRMLSQQVLGGLRLSITGRLVALSGIYSIYRRLRNIYLQSVIDRKRT